MTNASNVRTDSDSIAIKKIRIPRNGYSFPMVFNENAFSPPLLFLYFLYSISEEVTRVLMVCNLSPFKIDFVF